MKRASSIVIFALTIAVVGLASLQIRSGLSRGAVSERLKGIPEVGPRDRVILSDEKLAVTELEIQPASRRELRSHRMVPGRIDYNATRHVEVKSPFDGLIRRIDVKVGDRVIEGQVIAIVDSPELGEKRADVLLRQTDLQRALNDHEWWHSIQLNLDELLGRLKRPQKMPELAKDFADKPLGDYRQQIVSAYSQMQLDEMLTADISASKEGPFPKRLKLERDSARDTSASKYAAACEQATFDVKQKHLAAEAAMKDAEQRLAIAKQRLGLLVNQPQETVPEIGNESSLSTWPVKAPFTATVEEVLLAPKERIQLAQGLFQLADTSRLWVQADIRERDWSALSITAGQTVFVQTPALPGETLEAAVAFVGRTVVAETRAVPLIAEIENKGSLLKPGMFVRVMIPDGAARECLAIPQSSIAVNDGRTFVFVETGPREYRPRDVTTGLRVDPWIEIKSGLQPGDRVVTSGTAMLKAELLLEADD